MAFLNNDQQDPEIMNFGTPATQGGGGGTISRGAGGGSMSFGGGGADKGPTASGSFANLQGYLKANEGAGAGMVNAGTAGEQKQYSDLVGNINKDVSSVGGAINGRANYGIGESGFNDYGRYLSGLSSQTAPDLTGKYSGSAALIGQNATAASDPFRYSQNIASNLGARTGGAMGLNSAIMGHDASGVARIGELGKQWGGITDYLSGAQKTASDATAARNNSMTGAQGAYNAAKSSVDTLKGQSDAAYNTALTNNYNNALQSIGGMREGTEGTRAMIMARGMTDENKIRAPYNARLSSLYNNLTDPG